MPRELPLSVSLPTLLGVSPLLGGPLEDRSVIRESQDLRIVERALVDSGRAVDPALLTGFCVAPLDFLVTGEGGSQRVELIELNGSGMGGLTNLPVPVIRSILHTLSDVAHALDLRGPAVVLVSASGGAGASTSGQNALLHEKILYVDALLAGLGTLGKTVRVTTLAGLEALPRAATASEELVLVLGFSSELGDAIDVRSGETGTGEAWLCGRRVAGIVNDRLCLDVWSRTGEQRPPPFLAVNRSFVAGADKSVAYDVLGQMGLGPESPFPSVRFREPHRRAGCREELIRAIAGTLETRGSPVLIKPRGTGHGDGVEFFLDRAASGPEIEAAVDRSLASVAARYGSSARAFPYALCAFIDAATVQDPAHALHGHKFELRVAVFREGDVLRACPAIAKVASARWEPERPTRSMLLNNITYASRSSGRPGHDFMLPLCNPRTLESLGITQELLHETCRFATAYVAAALRSKAACAAPA